MYNKNIPSDLEVPSTAKLVKSTILAAAAALVLLVTVVMPAEYGIDPTGIGNVIGLKRMGEIKMSLAQEAEADRQAAATDQTTAVPVAQAAPEPAPASVEPASSIRADEMQVTLAPDEGTEIKVTLAKGKRVEYSWSSSGGKANFDVHGDSKALDIDYHGYEKGSEQTKQGVIEAAFDGNHGWFWRNRTKETITVTLKTSGEYTDIKQMK
jgi:hypothetical protein